MEKKYPGKGKPYRAIHDFRKAFLSGQTKTWPKYWQEFAEAMYEDLSRLELLLLTKGIEFPRPKDEE